MPHVGSFDHGGAIEQQAQHDPDLQARQRCADAEVPSLAKGNVAFAVGAVEPEFVRCIEVGGIAVGRPPQQKET